MIRWLVLGLPAQGWVCEPTGTLLVMYACHQAQLGVTIVTVLVVSSTFQAH